MTGNPRRTAYSGGRPLTAAEVRATRDWLNVPADWLASQLGVTARTLRNWESGAVAIDARAQDRDYSPNPPARSATTLDELVWVTRTAEWDITDLWGRRGYRRPALVVCRDDAELRRAYPDAWWPAGWYRALYARLMVGGLALRIRYPSTTAALGAAPVGDEFRPGRARKESVIALARRLDPRAPAPSPPTPL